ncbi:MAG: molecular chaperone HtpG [Geminicoccaceae bacterium]
MSEANFRPFEAEVGRVLDLVINSLYTNRDIFLRELISNASDACDKLRYAAIAETHLLEDDPELAIWLNVDQDAGLLTVRDNGIGMNQDELAENLGTIARSGTARFVEAVQEARAQGGDAALNLIGQFGVGFYATFMVADDVVVTSRKAGDEQGWIWRSNGKDGYSIAAAEGAVPRGTTISLSLKEDAKDYLDADALRRIVRTYSDHIGLPIRLEGADGKADQLNEASALWTRAKSDITDEQYNEFYHHIAHAFDEPFARCHFKAEGILSYTGLLFVPGMRPFDIYDPQRKHGVKLYVRRVFITDHAEGLLPKYLRFVAGVVDSEDLQLNVSRETLQHNAVIAKMRRALVSRVLGELKSKAKDDADAYLTFWENLGPILKEGLYEDSDNRDKLLELTRFRSSARDGWISLADYVEAMRPGQSEIYYLTGDDIDILKRSPQLEACRAKGVEVLLLTDPVDEFWLPEVSDHDGKKLVSLTRGKADLSQVQAPGDADDETSDDGGETAAESDFATLIAAFKTALGDNVKDVRKSDRLTESAVCLVADEFGLDMRMERILRQTNQLGALSARILEINPKHPLIGALAKTAAAGGHSEELADMAHLLLDQARIIEGEPLPDPAAFSKRMSAALAKGVAVSAA